VDTIMIIGRILFGLIFISSGINHLTKTQHMVGYAQFKKVPAAKASILLSGILLALGGLSVILGVYADLGALILAALLVIMALKMHDFWAQSDAQAKQTETIAFFKNISMAGGALFLFAVAGSEATNIGWELGSRLWGSAL
jgi:uncharacterized membrane protein YphA (DoxX/SURF4 family)